MVAQELLVQLLLQLQVVMVVQELHQVLQAHLHFTQVAVAVVVIHQVQAVLEVMVVEVMVEQPQLEQQGL